MMTKTQINKLIKMMNDLDYPFEAPLKESFIESIIQIEFNSNSTNYWRSYVMKLVFFLRINLIILLFKSNGWIRS